MRQLAYAVSSAHLHAAHRSIASAIGVPVSSQMQVRLFGLQFKLPPTPPAPGQSASRRLTVAASKSEALGWSGPAMAPASLPRHAPVDSLAYRGGTRTRTFIRKPLGIRKPSVAMLEALTSTPCWGSATTTARRPSVYCSSSRSPASAGSPGRSNLLLPLTPGVSMVALVPMIVTVVPMWLMTTAWLHDLCDHIPPAGQWYVCTRNCAPLLSVASKREKTPGAPSRSYLQLVCQKKGLM